jgi:hypothetical protein
VIDDFMRKTIVVLADQLELDAKQLLATAAAASATTTTSGEGGECEKLKTFGFDASGILPTVKAALQKKETASSSLATASDGPASNNALLLEQLGDLIRDLEYPFDVQLHCYHAEMEGKLTLTPLLGI